MTRSTNTSPDVNTPNSSFASPPDTAHGPQKSDKAFTPAKPVRRTRTKTGCLTCRIRRVKCDEAKPSCTRCTSTGRNCDGYPVAPNLSYPQRINTEPPEPSKSLILHSPGFPGPASEQRGLLYFRTRTASALSGCFFNDFWNGLVLQAADSEPTVRHAMLALSSLHESFDIFGDLPPNQIDAYHQLALEEYNKAVALTVNQISTKSLAQSEVTLITCILFICLELMQNNYNTAIDHLKNGLRILANHCGQSMPDGQFASSSGYPSMKANLGKLFTRIITQTIFIGTPFHKGYINPPNVEDNLGPFSSITQARESLDDLYTLMYLFLRSNRFANCNTVPVGPEKHITLLHRWQAKFLDFITRRRSFFTPRDCTGATIIQLHYLGLFIIAATAPDPTPAAFETFTPSFARIVALSETLLVPDSSGNSPFQDNQNSFSPLPNFSFEMGVIPPLYFTALRCRSSPIRWKAIALLRRAPAREGIWGAAMTSKMAQRFVEVNEEMAATPGMTDDLGINEMTDDADKFWTIRFKKPAMYERAIKMYIGEKGHNFGGREEVVTW